jgi:hypothetical protein
MSNFRETVPLNDGMLRVGAPAERGYPNPRVLLQR